MTLPVFRQRPTHRRVSASTSRWGPASTSVSVTADLAPTLDPLTSRVIPDLP